MIVFDNVTLRYHYDDFDVLKGASFSIVDGVNTILADAQSGKSSICKLLLKDIAPSSGKIVIDGNDISGITNNNLDILYLPRNPVFFEGRSVQYNMAYPLKIRKVARPERQARVKELAAQFGLPLEVKVSKLNRQQKLSLALARGLTVQRKYALFDSFFDDTDTVNIEHINSILQRFDTSVVLTSNVSIAQGHTIVLDGGVTAFQGDSEQAKQCATNLYWLAQK